MSKKYYKVLRSDSLSHLQLLLTDTRMRGWEPVGVLEIFKDEYAQPIQLRGYEDDTTEAITVVDVKY